MAYKLENVFASLPHTQRGMPIVVGGDPKGKTFLYANGNSIIIRDINDPGKSDVYTEHQTRTTVAKYAPSGFYIASGDQSGKIRIWDTTQVEHILKFEYQPLGGAIKDIAWSPDSKRMVVVGEGRERFANVFLWDTGSSVGEIIGHSKPINSVDYRQERPFRICTGGEDSAVGYYEGPPFRFKTTNKEHTRFVNVVRFAPDGSIFISGSADGKAHIFDGKTGERVGELGEKAHEGGIYGISFSGDSKEVLTVSGDKTAKIWNVSTRELVATFKMGTTILDQQVGCLWQGDNLLTFSLSGYVNYLDRENPETPLRIFKGHNKMITALAVKDRDIFTAAFDGGVCYWNADTGESNSMNGKGHSNQVSDMCIAGDNLFSIGVDDMVITSCVNTKTYGQQTKLDAQPKAISSVDGSLVAVACITEIVLLRNGNKVFAHKTKYEPQSVAIHPGQTELAVGGNNGFCYIYTINGDTLVDKKELKLENINASICDVAYSHNGAFLTACDTNRKVHLWNVPEDYKDMHSYQWSKHTARINSVAWSPDSRRVATASLDTSICIWNTENMTKSVHIKCAHQLNNVTRVEWLDNTTVVSVGQDCCVRKWSVPE